MINDGMEHEVTRTIQVSGIACSGCERTISKALTALNGVFEVRPDHHKDQVGVTYDLRKIRLEAIEDKLNKLGYPLENGFWIRKKRSFTHFKEQNEYDTMTHKGHCCSKPPAGA